MANRSLRPQYGNWVSKKLLYIFGVISGLLMILVIFSSFNLTHFLTLLISVLFFIFLVAFIYFLYAHHAFSEDGGNIQAKIRELIFDYVRFNGNGKILDIGCGNGALTIRLARKYPNSIIYGIDYWGGTWNYSKKSCIDNARAEGVEKQVVFKQASASSMPFDENNFDLVISNLVFHAVTDTKDKMNLIKEALSVLKPNGSFILQDLFLSSLYYKPIDKMINEIKSWGIQEVRFANTSQSNFIPGALKLPFMVGKIGILYGIK